jgi:Domain of Unknown Function (DUF1080)
MKITYAPRFVAFGGLLSVLACGADPAGSAQGASGASGASGAPGAAGQSVGGAVSSTTGGGVATAGASQAGTAGAANVAGSGGSVAGGGSGGASGAAGAGGGAAGAGGGTAGAGGGSADGWVKIFNGQDLTGWSPLIHKSAYKEDTYKTFRADPVNHVIKVTYEDYPGGTFEDRCGLLYYDKLLTNYRVRATYRFLEPQAKNPVSWGKNNSGLMIFGIDPAKVTGDPEFPPLIEIQLLGAGSSGGSTTPNVCVPGGMTMSKNTAACGDNHTGVAPPPAGDWVTVEAEVHVTGDTKVFQYPNKTTPIITMSGPTYQGKAVTGGYLSLQSESQPLEFKDVELMELP